MVYSSKNTNVIVSIVLIMITAAFFRFTALNLYPPGLYPDEAINGNNALLAISDDSSEGGFKIFYSENNGREGLFMNIIAGSVAVFGNEPWAIRMVSAIFGLLTVLGLFLFTKELFYEQASDFKIFGIPKNTLLGLLASFFLASSFWHILFSRIGFRAIMAPAFMVWAFYFLWLIFRPEFSHNKKTLFAAAGGILFGLGFHSYIAYRIVPVLLIFPFIKIWNLRKTFKFGTPGCLWCNFSIFIFFTAVAILPLGMYYLNNPADFLGRTSQISVFSSESPVKILLSNTLKTLGMFWYKGDFNWRHNFSGAPQLFPPVGILFILGIALSVIKIARKLKSGAGILNVAVLPEKILGAWFFLGLFPVIFSAEGIPHALRAIIVIPPVMIVSAMGMVFIMEGTKKWIDNKEAKFLEYTGQLKRLKKEFALLFFVFLFAVFGMTFNEYFLKWAPREEVYNSFSGNYLSIGRTLNDQPPSAPKYVIINASGTEVKIPGSPRTIPMPSQTIMFITDTWSAKNQNKKNINYLLPEEIGQISCPDSCFITTIEPDPVIYKNIKSNINGLSAMVENGIVILKK